MQYYSMKVLRHLRQVRLTAEWNDLVGLPEKYQILEKGATFIAQWCLPDVDVTWKSIANHLDALAEEVNNKN